MHYCTWSVSNRWQTEEKIFFGLLTTHRCYRLLIDVTDSSSKMSCMSLIRHRKSSINSFLESLPQPFKEINLCTMQLFVALASRELCAQKRKARKIILRSLPCFFGYGNVFFSPAELWECAFNSWVKRKVTCLFQDGCSNSRRITLLSINGKVLARILLNRLVPTMPKKMSPKASAASDEQRNNGHGVRPPAITRKVPRTKQRTAWTFVHLTKAFDTVSGKGLWLIFERHDCPPSSLRWRSRNLWRPSRPDQTQSRAVRAVPNLKWRGAVLCPGTHSLQHLL